MAKRKTTPLPAEIEPVVQPSVTGQPRTTPEVDPATQQANPIYSRFSDFDVHLFRAGKHQKLYEKFGSHVVEHNGVIGTYFAVWAPSARYVAVIGNFNGWDKGSAPMSVRWDSSGIWETFIPHIGRGETYKYFIVHEGGREVEKGDPYAHSWEVPPKTASLIWDTYHEWQDQDWMANRKAKNALNAPFSVYEMHLSSWRRDPGNPERELSYGEIADALVPYIQDMGFTHVEFMPVMQYPYAPSWGYQITGYYAPSSRFGTPQEFMQLIERLHQAGVGVILDWVPSHFPGDAHGLYEFDGSHLYEHPDPRRGYHPDWKSYIFNYGRPEVRSFLISNAMFWLDRCHVDGLRVDAVASMLYLDYSRNAGEWEPNALGGRENLEAVSLFKEINEAIYAQFPDTQVIAEESTSFPGVSRPVYVGGLGFGMKWMMGWMNDTLRYFERDPAFRKFHQDNLTFSTVYAYTENFMLPLSHDEVVYGKKSLVEKMPGDEWQRFANLRLLFSYMFTHSGTKLLFMGGEFGQTSEWKFDDSLDWHLLQHAPHKGTAACVKSLNHLYRTEPAMYERTFTADGFEWIDTADRENSIVSYARKGNDPNDTLLIVLNMTPIPRSNYRIGVPSAGSYCEIFNSDATEFYGSGVMNGTPIESEQTAWQGRPQSIQLNIPPLGAVVLKVGA
ncbi:1,4-alpha-glucan branching protein GlgB [Spirosoma utsteinense]|uniref:1,4-alpha-glucan branching protein GlgB n=1 Tax=Spirosoma utsteinense TaxID=2585773 RepID=UPI001644F797|nr:1,4-alpha-glucan branching protein GlgB [Spirosoma utsteinense]MBC3786802.1 1,4-alpha-glucan branching enzyme [Spirosoma utsteinense]